MNATATLTKREGEIAELIAWGATKKEVACKLFLSERTIENHTRHIYEKTGVTKSNELSAWWFCTRFRISFQLSPISRLIISLVLMSLVLTHEFMPNQTVIAPRCKRTECRRLQRRDDFDNHLIDIEL